MATKAGREADVLLWNYHDVAKTAPGAPTTVSVYGLSPTIHRVLAKHYRIGETHSNAYTIWKAMGEPQHLTTEQYTELKDRAGLQLLTSPVWMDVNAGQIQISTEMPRQSLSLLQITW